MNFHPVSNIFPMMSESEFIELKDDIEKNGLIEPIWTHNGKIIDGRNRYNACTELGIKPTCREWVAKNGSSIVDFVISLNLKRRHLNASQRAMSSAQALPFFEKEAKERQLSSLKRGNKSPDRELIPERKGGRSRDMVARIFGLSGRYVQHAKNICEASPELAAQIRDGELTITQALTQIKRQKDLDSLKRAGKQFKSNHHIKIVYADFPEWCKDNLSDESVDLILTDPPYDEKSLDLYRELAKVGKRMLKPCGWLIVYCNIKFIPRVMNILSEDLVYWWTFCLRFKGKTRLNFNTLNSWKPILIYHKNPPTLPKLTSDVIETTKREKEFHDWQQSEEPYKYLIERFSNVGDLVLDPMAGSGTVLKASKDLKRKCIGIDSNKKCIEIMRGRLF
jgi:hypothetical protein